MGNGLSSIGAWIFHECSSLASVTIPDSVTSIESLAFSFCTSLTSINIPASVASIGEYAFQCCESLTIYCEAQSKPDGWNPNWNPFNYPVVWGYKSKP
ncbi:MAG: leucine-rich repeat domain-containing protein [Bacilli bacterium]|nr:leucine-rich repeat domain-containing protein [Bacilli bacterium]